MKINRTLRRLALTLLAVAVFGGGGKAFMAPNTAYAFGFTKCTCDKEKNCGDNDCKRAKQPIEDDHEQGRKDIILFIQKQFNKNRTWITEDFFKQHWLKAAMKMTEQLSSVGMQQAFIVGTMLDAKHQLETQRLLQELQFEAHKNYQPSQDFCWFGTNARSMAHSEQKGRLNAQALNARQIERQLGSAPSADKGVAGGFNRGEDRLARWEHFASTYCDPRDNNFTGTPKTGLSMACTGGGRPNRDIDFTSTMEYPRTLNANFDDNTPTDDEEDVLALSSNLYGHNVLTRNIDENYLKNTELQHLYLALRSVAAKRAVAQNSFDAIAGLKSSGTTDVGKPGSQTRNFMGAVLVELGMPESDVYKILGENPSYFAQLEVLAKRIYQNPDFYTNLYDKPANVARKSVALKAIELMLDRAIYESEIRQEMVTSVLLSAQLHQAKSTANSALNNAERD